MADRWDELLRHFADLGVDVERQPLTNKRGCYRAGLNLVILNSKLNAAQALSTGYHELVHVMFGDTASTARSERRANLYAAALAVSIPEYKRAERLVGSHAGALARELGVTRHLIENWRTWYDLNHLRERAPGEWHEPADVY